MAETKKLESEVAGDPEIPLERDLEAGDSLARGRSILANAESARLVPGASRYYSYQPCR